MIFITPASTYPLQVVQAGRWVEKNPGLKGQALDDAAAQQDWDPSVKSLVQFPDVLKRMNDNLDWTQDLGDAVLAQQSEVMDAVQRMRQLAHESGNLKTTSEQKVIVEEKIIRVEPSTQVVYVPAYNPTVVYGTAWAPTTYYYPVYTQPPSYWYPPGYAASNLVSFGVGMAVGAALWGDCDWHHGGLHYNHGHHHWGGGHGDIDIDRNVNIGDINIDRSRNFSSNRVTKWEHNPSNRKNVRYRDTATTQKFSNIKTDGTRRTRVDRNTARGFDRGTSRQTTRLASREQPRAQTRTTTRTQPRTQARTQTREATRTQPRTQTRTQTRTRTRPSSRTTGRSSSAFNVGNSSFDRAASRRGASSRGSVSRGGMAGGARGRGGARRR